MNKLKRNKNNTHYSAIPVLSYNGIITEIISNRNYGKTWAFKRRAFRRAVKRGKKTIWLRTFRKEAKEAINTFYSSADLQNFCGIIPYEEKTKTGNFKQNGNTFYVLRNGKWEWFLKVFALSDSNALRSADDVNTDTIVYDEFTTTAEKMKRYRGNIVNDFVDLFFSAKREHEVRCFLLGNKENVLNPFFAYFGIKPLPESWEGIRSYRDGSIVIQQINNKPIKKSTYDNKVESLLAGTAYGNYIYNDGYKGAQKIKRARPPASAAQYIQLDIDGNTIRIMVDNGLYYVTGTIDKTSRVFTLRPLNKYRYENLLLKRHRPYFSGIIAALSVNAVAYESQAIYEAIQPFYRWLSF